MMRLVGVLGFFLGWSLTSALVAASPPAATAQAQEVDLSGDWRVTFDGFLSGTCVARFDQTGTALTVDAVCDALGNGSFQGTVDIHAGIFALEGDLPLVPTVSVEATLLEGAQRFAGTWSVDDIMMEGTLQGERIEVAGAPETALARSWVLEFIGATGDQCQGTAQADGDGVTLDLSCNSTGSGTLRGRLAGEQLLLEGAALGRPVTLSAAVALGGGAFAGSWRAQDGSTEGVVLGVAAAESGRSVPSLTGRWSGTIQAGVFQVSCAAGIEETGSSLLMVTSCTPVGPSGVLQGSVDPATGCSLYDAKGGTL